MEEARLTLRLHTRLGIGPERIPVIPQIEPDITAARLPNHVVAVGMMPAEANDFAALPRPPAYRLELLLDQRFAQDRPVVANPGRRAARRKRNRELLQLAVGPAERSRFTREVIDPGVLDLGVVDLSDYHAL